MRKAGRSARIAALMPSVAWAWEQMVTDRGQVRVDHLAGELGWNRKRLWSRFRAQIGLTPKRAAQMVRFDHAATAWPPGAAPPGWRPGAATSTSPTSTATSWPSPG